MNFFVKYIVLIILMICRFSPNLLSQEASKNEIRIQNSQIKDSIDALKKRIEELEKQVQENSINDRINKEVLSSNQQSVLDIAGKIIDWSAMFFGIFVIILAVAGWIAAKRFSEIDKIRKQFENLLRDAEKNVEEQLIELSNLKTRFEEDKEKSMKILFPIIEGQWLFHQGKHQKAIKEFKKAYKIDPDNPQIYNKLNQLLMENGRIDEAINNLENLNVKFPDDLNILLSLGVAHRRKGKYETSKEYFNRCLHLHPNDHMTEYHLGVVYLFERNYKSAEEYFLKAHRHHESIKGSSSYWLLTNLGITQKLQKNEQESQKNIKLALKLIEERLLRTPQHPQAWAYKGLVELCSKDENFKMAFKYFNKAISFNLQPAVAESMKIRLKLLFPENKEIINNILKELDQVSFKIISV